MRRVIVVGAGVAGTAAALAAARAGADVTLVSGGPGASVLAGGALDDVPWERADARGEPPASLSEGARATLAELDAYDVGDHRALLAATTGLVRPARGTDRALLDLGRLARGTVLVPDLAHASWDAPAFAREWSASWLARGAGLHFAPVAATLLRYTEERAFADAEIAGRHDEGARLDWLAGRVREACAGAGRDVAGFVLPPWLGAVRERATELTLRAGVPCGEALGGVGGPSGLRFEHARDRALAVAKVTVVQGHASRAEHVGRRGADLPWRVDVEVRGEGPRAIAGHAVVLATGGLLGGGLEYTPAGAYFAGALPGPPRPLLRVTCEAPVRIGAHGRPLDEASSQFGAAPETHAWPYSETPLLDHAGVLVHDEGEVTGAPPGLHATGELAAGPAHTWLAALSHGARAGGAAARD